ncbi:hypothetical protein [Limnohabitans radicicola]|uniref:Uncharacterized protein n=1 Tax=Limnohabitans radicicola TaxID=2771427 RepID=A0A927FID9_9BURK|nr:hypothetical protein [Limnohabitans radicicola]MBD8051077.1 hypothetical protein [Limnohabitans radicicola]
MRKLATHLSKRLAKPLGMGKHEAQGDTPRDEDVAHNASTAGLYLLGGLGDSRQMYSLDEHWRVQSHRKVDPGSAKGMVIAADPALDLARRIDNTFSERAQLSEFASDAGEPLLSVKTKASSSFKQLFARKSPTIDDEGETLTAAQAIESRGWWLCTPVERLKSLPSATRVSPVASTLLKLLQAHSKDSGQQMDSAATVVALVFPGAPQVTDYQIVVLATFTTAGHLEGLDFVPGSGLSVQQVISNYVSLRKLNADGVWPQEQLILASSEDAQVKKWLAGATTYPRHQMILGMPVQQAARLGTAVSAAALAATLAYSGWSHWQLSQLRSAMADAQAQQVRSRTQAVAAVREHSLGHVLLHSGLDSERAIDLAVQAWQPGTLIEMVASRERVSLTATAPLGQSEGAEDSATTPDVSAAAALVSAAAPKGCTAAPTQVNASMRQMVITYECTLQNPELERLRAAGF